MDESSPTALRLPFPPLSALPSAEPSARLRGMRVLIITHDASASGAPRVCVEMAQALAGLGAAVSLAVQGRAVARRADRDALASLLGGASAADFAVVGLTLRAVQDADAVIVSTAVAPNSAWIAAAAAGPSASFLSSAAELTATLLDLAAYATGISRTSALQVRPPARLVWLVHESGAVMSALGRTATNAAVAALSDPRGRVDNVVFISHAAQSWWLDEVGRQGATLAVPRQLVLHWGVPRWKLEHLASPERAADARVRLRRQLGLADADFVFLVVGSFHPMKGLAGIVRAFLDARDACPRATAAAGRLRLVAVGGGLGAPDYFPRVFADAESVLTLEDVRLLPSTSDVAAYFAMADAVVSNTQGAGETWGLATLEALAAGKVVLAAANGGTLEQLRHNETALLHPGSDAESAVTQQPRRFFSDVAAPSKLARHMCAVATDVDLLERLRSAGSAHVRSALGQDHIDAALTALLG
jgi:glycosyltransferase involved in cell wall biosynthesis